MICPPRPFQGGRTAKATLGGNDAGATVGCDRMRAVSEAARERGEGEGEGGCVCRTTRPTV